MPNRYKDWLNQAEDDLEHARKSIVMKDFSWSCFASQQAAEKALKGLYLFLTGEGWGHAIGKLLEELPEDRINVTDDLLRKGRHLDKFYIPTRYPNGFDVGTSSEYYSEKEAKEAFEYAKDILSWVQGQIH